MIRLPKSTKVYRDYVLSFLVTLAVGLAPLLGKVHVPLFTPILDVFPRNLSQTLIPFVAFLMALPAVAVQYVGKDIVARKHLDRWFGWNFVLLALTTIALYVVYSYTVTQVSFEGEHGVVAYVTGSKMLHDCPCVAAKLPMSTCIGEKITLNPAQVTACYDPAEINLRKAILSTLYMMMMLSFGTLIGLLIVRENQPRSQRKRQPKRQPRPRKRKRRSSPSPPPAGA